MKRVSVVLIAVCVLAGAWLAAETLDEILAKNYESRGGLDKLQAIKTTRIKGKMMQSMMNMEFPMDLWYRKPNCIRMEAEFQGKKIVQGYDGKTVWWIMPFMGSEEPQEMPEAQAKEVIDMAESMDPLVDYKAQGHTLEFLGKEEMEGTEVYKLKLSRKNGKVTTFYLDTDSGIELKSTTYIKRGESEVLVESVFGDYQEVDGIMFPFSLESKMDGTTAMTLIFESYTLNEEMPDELFTMPAKQETPAAGEKQ